MVEKTELEESTEKTAEEVALPISIRQRLSRLNKLHYLGIAIILVTLPLLVFASKQQTDSLTRAQGNETILSTIDEILEDENNVPDDPDVAPNDVATTKLAAEVDSLPSAASTTSKPNIVVIMLDDINPIDNRLWNASILPNINKYFVQQGIRFDNYYGETSLCCPGRAGFLSGQHTQNHGVADLDGTKFNPTETFAPKLQSSGYHTIFAGKYLNNFQAIPAAKAVPPGWSTFNGQYERNGKYYGYRMINKNGVITSYGSTAVDYSTDVIANLTIKHIKAAPVNKPIFAYVNPYASHGPQTPAPRHKLDTRCNIPAWNPLSYNEKDISDKPKYIRDLPLLKSTNGYSLTRDCKPLLAVDEMVGRIATTLTKQGRLANTIFILTADNGMTWGAHRMTEKTVPHSTQLPLLISWPEGRGVSPKVENSAVLNIDFASTFCEIAGCTMGPYPNGQQKSDGLSFFNLIKNQPLPWTRDAFLESQPSLANNFGNSPIGPTWWALRTTTQNSLGLWHYVEYSTGEKELYDLSNGPCYTWTPAKSGDPCELNNLLGPNQTPSAATLALADKLHNRLVQLKAEKGGPSITPTPTSTLTPTP